MSLLYNKSIVKRKWPGNEEVFENSLLNEVGFLNAAPMELHDFGIPKKSVESNRLPLLVFPGYPHYHIKTKRMVV